MAYLGTFTEVGTVDTASIADGAVTADKLASGVGGSPSIDDNGNATAITIDSSERVGIGTLSPARELHVKSSDGYAQCILEGTTASELWFTDVGDGSKNGMVKYDHSSESMRLYTNNAERLRIASDGRGLSEFTAKAWCKIWGAAQNLMASHNVSSVVDNGTGKGTINFAVSMTDGNYAVATHTEDGSGFNDQPTINRDGTQTRSTSQFQYYTYMNGSLNDAVDTSFIFFGE